MSVLLYIKTTATCSVTIRLNKTCPLLGNLLNAFKDDILGISMKDKSISGLRNVLKKANELLNKI
jgi:hypothetical protein